MRGPALAVLAALGLVWGGPVTAQISPGPLAAAHQRLEGSLQCRTCHGSGGSAAMTTQCLACHREVAWLAQRRLGLHGTERGAACATCHPDHAGLEFAMVSWTEGNAERFDHRRTGWTLEGKHREAKCDACHTTEFRRSPAAALVPQGQPGRWIGLDRGCASCHEDAHRGALGGRCRDCHDTQRWRPALGFDHGRTRYPLTGRHRDTDCKACHLAAAVATARTTAGQLIPVYRPLPFDRCSDCHADPHAGALGPACARCHETAGFTTIARGAFDHDRTRYPLRGRHAGVACSRCHDFATPAGKRPAFASCTNCHADAHAGTATLAGRPADCSACHEVAGFRPAVFTAAQHARTRYPLEGRHQAVACGNCHVKSPAGVAPSRLGSAGVVIRPAFARCRDCHADDHGGQLAGRTDRGECAGCHDLTGWRPSTYRAADHARLKLPLEGRHREVPCAACHGPNRTGLPPMPPAATLGRAGVLFRVTQTGCPACHVDPHLGRFSAGGPRPAPRGCETCHGADRFRPSTVGVTAHASAAFPLEGAHRAVPCAACHEEMRHGDTGSTLIGAVAGGRTRLPFVVKGIRCQDCHTDPHGDQFADRGGCDRCHGLDTFRPAARFAHDRETTFPLAGAHARVACAGCHLPTVDASGRTRLDYRRAPTRCESCHAGEGRRR